MSEAPRELWRHPKPTETQIWAFKEGVNRKYALQLETYDDLYHWSIENIAHFWEETWHFTGIKASKTYNKVRGTIYFHIVTCLFKLLFYPAK